jgi:nucleoid DNA-binding protein
MNKTELTTVVFNKLSNQLSKKKDVEDVINTLLDTIKESLMNNQKITFKGFLSLGTTLVQEKSGNCFGRDWTTSTKYIPSTKFSSSFKKMLEKNTKV